MATRNHEETLSRVVIRGPGSGFSGQVGYGPGLDFEKLSGCPNLHLESISVLSTITKVSSIVIQLVIVRLCAVKNLRILKSRKPVAKRL